MSESKTESTNAGTIFTQVENMNFHPTIINDPTGAILAFGDLHGNAMKAIYLLIGQGVMKLQDEADYATLMAIYLKSAPRVLTPVDLKNFERIINCAKITKPALLIIIGDELADRGKNDWFTLLVLDKLNKEGVPYRIQLSNHGVLALQSFAQKKRLRQVLEGDQEQSLHNLWTLVESKKIEIKRLLDMVPEVYLKHLALIGYVKTADKELTLFTHAPVGLETVEGLAHKFGVTYNESSLEALIQCIDEINKKASEAILGNTFTPDYFDNLNFDVSDGNPLTALFWARKLTDYCKIVPTGENFTLAEIIHGHIGEGYPLVGPMAKKFKNLDSDFGKFPSPLNPSRFDNGLCPLFCDKKSAVLQLWAYYNSTPAIVPADESGLLSPKRGGEALSSQKAFRQRFEEIVHGHTKSPDGELGLPPQEADSDSPTAKRARPGTPLATK